MNISNMENLSKDLEIHRISKSVPFILLHVFLERYSTAGIASNYFKLKHVHLLNFVNFLRCSRAVPRL